MESNQSDMDDRISTLHDSLLCYILSFLSTKESVVTSVLSKRWKHLWRFVPTLDFEGTKLTGNTYWRFFEWIDSVILSRDPNQPIKKFCFTSSLDLVNYSNLDQWVCTVLQRGVEYLDLDFFDYFGHLDYPECDSLDDYSVLDDVLSYGVFSCRTLVVLKLKEIYVSADLSFDLPSLKTLHLDRADFTDRSHLSVLLACCPILEDLVLKHLFFQSCSSKLHFTILPKLVRAYMDNGDVLLEVVSNVQFLRINMRREALVINKAGYMDLIFTNLIHIELGYNHYTIEGDLLEMIGMLYHCPNVRYLVLYGADYFFFENTIEPSFEDRPYPPCVPHCISNNLKTCIIENYDGFVVLLNFAKYVMQNAGLLRDMIIHSVTNGKKGEHQMLEELSLCTRISSSCKLIFD